jgi:hypothetical protein
MAGKRGVGGALVEPSSALMTRVQCSGGPRGSRFSLALAAALFLGYLPLACVLPAARARADNVATAFRRGASHGAPLHVHTGARYPGEMVLLARPMRLRGGKMMNTDAAKKTEKRKRTMLSQAGGVSKPQVARRRGSKLGKSKTGKSRRPEHGSRCMDDPAPRIVALIPASRSASADAAFDRIVESCRALGDMHDALPSAWSAADASSALRPKVVTLRLPASCGAVGGRRVTLLRVDTTKTSALLDALKVADCAVLVHHGAELLAPSCSISSPFEMLAHADQRGVGSAHR